MRFHSNARAYLDLGYAVESIQVHFDPAVAGVPEGLPGLRHTTRIVPQARPPRIASRLLYRFGIPHRWSLAYYFPCLDAVRDAVLERERLTPGAIHHIETDAHSSAVYALPPLRIVLGHHDIYSDIVRSVHEIAREREGNRPPTAGEIREVRFAERFIRGAAGRARALLCGSLRDRDVVRSWGVEQAEYLPCAAFAEEPLERVTGAAGEPLRLIHVGRINHLPTFRSLEFLFTHIWPQLPEALRGRLRLRVIGQISEEEPLCRRILDLAAPFGEVEFTGFVPDLAGELAAADLHIVLATAATGYRTRIIESWAAGVPVLSNTTGADGLEALRPGENILIADEAAAVVRELERVLAGRERLREVAAAGRETYRDFYSRPVVARRLGEILARRLGD